MQQYLLTLIGITSAGVGVSSASYMTKSMQEQISREPTQRPASSRVNMNGFGRIMTDLMHVQLTGVLRSATC